MKNAPADDNLKGFIGFRIVILIVFVFVALLGGLVYFKIIKLSGNPFYSLFQNDITLPDQENLVSDLNKTAESSETYNSKQVYDINELVNQLKLSSRIEATLVSYENDRLELKTSDADYLLVPYNFADYVQVMSFPSSNVEKQLLVLKVTNADDPSKILYEPLFEKDLQQVVSKKVFLSFYDTYTHDGKEQVQFVGVMYETK